MQVINNITMLSVILCGAALIREREHGTIEHLLVMPVTPIDIMLSKIWANGLVIVVAALLSFFLVVGWLLQVPIAGSITLFIAGAVLYQFSVTALGILLATFTTSMQQFGLLVIPVLIAMNLLSGSRTPLESMPEWLQYVMQVAPSTHFVGFSQAVLYRAADLTIVWPKMLAMTAIGTLFFTVALVRFRQSVMTAQ
jgi:ABC-2 type transport system permease protein